MQVYAEVDPDDVLRECDDSDLDDEIERRQRDKTYRGKSVGNTARANLTLIYEEFRRRDDAPPILREYLYDELGRILP
jgi:hypothetical protein